MAEVVGIRAGITESDGIGTPTLTGSDDDLLAKRADEVIYLMF